MGAEALPAWSIADTTIVYSPSVFAAAGSVSVIGCCVPEAHVIADPEPVALPIGHVVLEPVAPLGLSPWSVTNRPVVLETPEPETPVVFDVSMTLKLALVGAPVAM